MDKSCHQSIKLPKWHVKPSEISIALHNPAWNPGGDVKGANCLAKQRRIVPPPKKKKSEKIVSHLPLMATMQNGGREWERKHHWRESSMTFIIEEKYFDPLKLVIIRTTLTLNRRNVFHTKRLSRSLAFGLAANRETWLSRLWPQFVTETKLMMFMGRLWS